MTTSSSYAWRNWRFDAPAGLADQSMIMLAADDRSLTLARDDLGGRTLADYVDETQREIAARVRSYRFGKKDARANGSIIVEISGKTDDGDPAAQAQAFIPDGGDAVLTVTATAAASATALALLESFLATLRQVPG